MIHCTMEDLIALKDNEGTAWARKHLGECAECRAELDALHQRVARLKALPAVTPPRDRWPVVRERVLAEQRQRRGTHVRWAAVAIAASVVAIIGTRALDQRQMAATNQRELQQLVTRSQQLEAALREYDPDHRVLTGSTAGAVSVIEDGIRAIDAQIGQPAQQTGNELDLWRNRVALMQGLVNVHYTRAAGPGM